jgi:nickel-dependent lactate racemase
MTMPGAEAGRLEGNPVRDDIEEAARFIRVDFIVNVVIDEHRDVAGAFAGHPVDAHRAGCAFLDGLYRIPIAARADVVVATPGGWPKDMNLYQAQKALDNAKGAVRKGGVVILVAACPEGMGEETFERWYRECSCAGDLIDRVNTRFELGGHKAAAIAMVLRDAEVWLVSDLSPDRVESLFLRPFPDVGAALEEAFRRRGKDAKVLVMPHAASTLPTDP